MRFCELVLALETGQSMQSIIVPMKWLQNSIVLGRCAS